MERIVYKNYTIRAKPEQNVENQRWTMKIGIGLSSDGQEKERAFSLADTFATRTEAMQACMQFGKDIIDNKVSGCSVSAL